MASVDRRRKEYVGEAEPLAGKRMEGKVVLVGEVGEGW
jgi:hypothetical protein